MKETTVAQITDLEQITRIKDGNDSSWTSNCSDLSHCSFQNILCILILPSYFIIIDAYSIKRPDLIYLLIWLAILRCIFCLRIEIKQLKSNKLSTLSFIIRSSCLICSLSYQKLAFLIKIFYLQATVLHQLPRKGLTREAHILPAAYTVSYSKTSLRRKKGIFVRVLMILCNRVSSRYDR